MTPAVAIRVVTGRSAAQRGAILRAHQRRAGMTLIEVVVVIVIIALAGAGLSFSLGALTKTALRSGASKLAAAARFAYSRATIRGCTVRIAFDVPGGAFSIEEAGSRITLAKKDDPRKKDSKDDSGNEAVAVDPWEAAKNRVQQAVHPTLGASPFKPLSTESGKAMTRYQNVSLGRRIQIVKLYVPHTPDPVEQGKGAVHFFPGGIGEHAVIQLSDGTDAVFSVEIFPLTGRAKIRGEAYEPKQLLGDPDERDPQEDTW